MELMLLFKKVISALAILPILEKVVASYKSGTTALSVLVSTN
jgi:hypothetical protein